MDTADLHPLVEDLSSNIDDLEESLEPLLKTSLSHSTSKLPLLDKAKLYVLATYAIESVLFSCLRLNGVDAKEHPVFQEIDRVKEYFNKIKVAETAGAKRNTTLDKEAAGRFIRHGLAGNEKYDRQRAERAAGEKARGKRKLEEIATGTHTRFDGSAKRIRAMEEDRNGTRSTDGEAASGTKSLGASAATTEAEITEPEPLEGKSKAEKKAAKRKRREERRLAALGEEVSENAPVTTSGASKEASEDEDDGSDDNESPKVPKTSREALDTLLQSSPTGESKSEKKRKKHKRKAQALEDVRADEMK